jgi:hypothetical protein
MADPRVFDTSVSVAREEALDAVLKLLQDVPDAQQPFSERYGNPNLYGSPTTLLEAARDDHQVRDTHGLTIMLQALAHVLTAQQKRIEELEATVKPAKAATATKATPKPEPKKGAAKAKR